VSVVWTSYWAQAGWRYYTGYAEPRGYCEFQGVPDEHSNNYFIDEYTIAHATHVYQVRFNDSDDWVCKINDSRKASQPRTIMGFGSGTWMPVQGENHGTHVQIGEMDPGRLRFDILRYQAPSTTTWLPMDLAGSLNSVSFPFGRDNPDPDVLRVWTVAH
jgi:hypothetical protein